MVDLEADGICAACERVGPVGAPCGGDVCRRRGYHFIPRAYAPRPEEAPDARVGQMWDAYLIVRRIGHGGVGTVYKALQTAVMLEAALKVVSTGSAALAERFWGEAAALARLNHPNIVRLLHFGTCRGAQYLVMEYVPGGCTLARLADEGLTVARVFGILDQLVDALEAAHAVGVVHRDVKPANVMLQPLPSTRDFVRLVDFGLAKFTESGGSTRITAGTPRYMAPEQITRRAIGPWSDWYAIGVIAFELLTGQRAWSGASTVEIIADKSRSDHRLVDQPAAAHLPSAAREALARLVAHDVEARAGTAAEVRALLATARDAMRAMVGHGSEGATDWARATMLTSGAEVDREALRRTLFDGSMGARVDGSEAVRRAERRTLIAPSGGMGGMVEMAPMTPMAPMVPMAEMAGPARVVEPAPAPAGRRRRPWAMIAALGVVASGALLGGVLALSDGGDGSVDADADSAPEVVTLRAAPLPAVEDAPRVIDEAGEPDARPEVEPDAASVDVEPPAARRPRVSERPAAVRRPPSAQVWLDEGRAALRDGRWVEAEAAFGRVPRGASQYVDAIEGMARAAFGRGDHARALALVEEALAGRPDDARLQAWKGDIFHRMGLSLRACEAWNVAVRLDRELEVDPAYKRICKLE